MTDPTIFSPDQLQRIVAETLPALPAGHTNAIVGAIDKDGVKVVAGFSFDDARWKFDGAFTHDWTGENKVGAQVLYSWQ